MSTNDDNSPQSSRARLLESVLGTTADASGKPAMHINSITATVRENFSTYQSHNEQTSVDAQ
jgi:hypothetical protein